MKRICVLVSSLFDIVFMLTMLAATGFLGYGASVLFGASSPMVDRIDGNWEFGDLILGVTGGLVAVIGGVLVAIAIFTAFAFFVGLNLVIADFRFVGSGTFEDDHKRDSFRTFAFIEGGIGVIGFFLAIVTANIEELKGEEGVGIVIAVLCLAGGVALITAVLKIIAIYLEKKERIDRLPPRHSDYNAYD